MSVLSPQKLFGGLAPIWDTMLKTPFSPLSFGKSFMKIRSGIPENGCLIVVADGKNAVKHIRIRLIGGCVNYDPHMTVTYLTTGFHI